MQCPPATQGSTGSWVAGDTWGMSPLEHLRFQSLEQTGGRLPGVGCVRRASWTKCSVSHLAVPTTQVGEIMVPQGPLCWKGWIVGSVWLDVSRRGSCRRSEPESGEWRPPTTVSTLGGQERLPVTHSYRHHNSFQLERRAGEEGTRVQFLVNRGSLAEDCP